MRIVMGAKVLRLKQKSRRLWLPCETWNAATGPWITSRAGRRGMRGQAFLDGSGSLPLLQDLHENSRFTFPRQTFGFLLRSKEILFISICPFPSLCILYLCFPFLGSICFTPLTRSAESFAGPAPRWCQLLYQALRCLTGDRGGARHAGRAFRVSRVCTASKVV